MGGPASDYDRYVRAEWARFHERDERLAAARAATRGLDVARVLDVGCGAGQELSPFVSAGALGVGVDIAAEVGRAGRELHAATYPGARVAFGRAAAEALPFADGTFDVVVSRIALPYTDNARALDEMARVLRAGGLLLLKIHHARFYLRQLRRALPQGDLRSVVHGARVLTAGALYHLTGRQIRHRLVGGETFQTRWLLRRELARRGLAIVGELPDSNPATPAFVIRKG